MAITSLSDLDGSNVITDEQIQGLLANILVRQNNLLTGTDNLYDYRENGDAGHEVKPSALLEQLRKQAEMLQKMLADPASRGDIAMVISQWDNPDGCMSPCCGD